MNEKQKKYLIDSLLGYALFLMMFASIYLFREPMPVVLAIMMIVMLLRGKEYRYNKELSEQAMKEFSEYAKQHTGLLLSIALYTTALPILIFVLAKNDYMNIKGEPRALVKYALLFSLPFILFDIGHRAYIYNKYERHTEQSNQGDGE